MLLSDVGLIFFAKGDLKNISYVFPWNMLILIVSYSFYTCENLIEKALEVI
jgi:hypothetical protein